MLEVSASSKLFEEQNEEDASKLEVVKLGIWLYFLLILFEGALRKWVFPGLASPLLLIRDPLAIWLLFTGYKKGLFSLNLYILSCWFLALIALYTTIFWGHGNLVVALYGFRIFFLHFPLIFLIAQLFNKQDVEQLGRVLLWIHIGMTILVAIQFFSPQTAWVNRGIGGELEGSGFSGGGGYYRVPGTFSFTNGLALFYGLVSAFVFYFWLTPNSRISKCLLFVAFISLLIAIPLSISRTVFYQFILTAGFSIFTTVKRTRTFFRILGSFLACVVFIYLLSMLDFFQTAVLAFMDRFNHANAVEGGLEGTLVNRLFGGAFDALTYSYNDSFWGGGLGMGTNVGAFLLTGNNGFLIAEEEWGRLVGEMGFLLGFLLIAIRFVLVLNMFKKSWSAISKGNYLPWLLISFCGTLLLFGSWAQPTALGFTVFSGGLMLASLKSE